MKNLTFIFSLKFSSLCAFATLCLSGIIFFSSAQAQENFSHKLFDEALARWAKEKTVEYKNLKQDIDFWIYVYSFWDVDEKMFQTENEQKAFWINVYNASALKLILDNYPTTSIQKLGSRFSSPWDKKEIVEAGGKLHTLNFLREEILVKRFRDPRIHFALFTATNSSPRLKVFHADSLEQELNDAATEFINDKKNVRFDKTENSAYLSKIFEWYARDFTSRETNILRFIAPYLSEEERPFAFTVPLVKFLEYDWTLNEKSPPKK